MSNSQTKAPHESPPNGGPRVVYESPSLCFEDIAGGAEARKRTFARDTSAAGVCVVDGMGLRLTVDRGALVVEDGMGDQRRTRRFDKATHGLSRLVVLGSTGWVTLDALTWCRRLGVGIVVLAPDGIPTLTSTPRQTDDARLRRLLAMAPDLPVGIDIARSLLSRKLSGQAELLAVRFDEPDAATTIADLAEACADVNTVDGLRQLEASAAALYWQSWAGRAECVPNFAARDRSRVPPHWSRYEGRRSVLASGNANRKAERPVNALLNYAYALLESEAILACQAVGLDPGLGIVHNDTKGRQSLALDLIEPVRPSVDGFVLDLLAQRTFRKAEFTETPDGHCRIKAPLTHELAETLPRWAQAVAPVAEEVAHTLGLAMAGKYVPATPLTTRKQRHAQAAVKARKEVARTTATSSVRQQRPTGSAPRKLWSCPGCGGEVTHRKRTRCDACIAADPGQSPVIKGSRGAAIAARKRALREWDEANPGAAFDPEYFAREIQPKLATVKLSVIMEAAGVSKSYASTIRSGRYTPHVSTWAALDALAADGSTGPHDLRSDTTGRYGAVRRTS
jgi:CRISPR-associated endonuclease Cas1